MARAVFDIRVGQDEEVEAEVYTSSGRDGATLYIAIGDAMKGRTQLYLYGATPEQLINLGRQIAGEAELVQSLIAASKEAVRA
jgi:hypothetical protein